MTLTDEAILALIDTKLKEQEEWFVAQLNEVKTENVDLKERVAVLESDLVQAFKELEITKRATYYTDQYQRRNNLEISGIPETIQGDELEDVCLKLVNNICTEEGAPRDGDLEVGSLDVEGCHRLQTKDKHNIKNTIIRFTNRRVCEEALQNKRKIRDVKIQGLGKVVKDIYINENLCSYYKDLAAKCRRLSSKHQIDYTWVKHGLVKVKLLSGATKSITHQNDLDKLFPNFVYFDNFFFSFATMR